MNLRIPTTPPRPHLICINNPLRFTYLYNTFFTLSSSSCIPFQTFLITVNMAIKLHGLVGSPATFRAMATLYEKDVEFQFVPVDFATQEHKSPKFLALNVLYTFYISLDYYFTRFDVSYLYKFIYIRSHSVKFPFLRMEISSYSVIIYFHYITYY